MQAIQTTVSRNEAFHGEFYSLRADLVHRILTGGLTEKNIQMLHDAIDEMESRNINPESFLRYVEGAVVMVSKRPD